MPAVFLRHIFLQLKFVHPHTSPFPANLLINVKPRFQKNRGLFVADINAHNNKACKRKMFCRPGSRSTAVLREQMSCIHAMRGMNAAISFSLRQQLHQQLLVLPALLLPWRSRSGETLHHRRPYKHSSAFPHCVSYP